MASKISSAVEAGLRRDEDHRRVTEELQVVARLFFEDRHFSGGLAVGAVDRDRVPLIDDDDDGASGLVRVTGDRRVERGDAFGGIDDDQCHIGGFEMLARHDHRELLGHQVRLAFAADAGSVDEAEGLAVALDTSSTASRVVPAIGETMARPFR